MHKYISMDDMAGIIKEQFEAGGEEVKFTPRGNSMLPMLRNDRDVVILVRPKCKMKKYDIPLYKRDDGKYVLHRIVGISGDGNYILCGDNQVVREYGIRDDQIIGVVSAYIKNGKKKTVNNFGYRIYCHIWVFIMPLRKCKRKLRRIAGRIKRKLKTFI